MDTDLKKYPTRFYGRTWPFSLGLVYFVPCAVGLWIAVLSSIFLEIPVSDKITMGIMFAVFGSIVTLLAFVCAFQVLARRRFPFLQIHRKGLEIRTVGVPIYIDPVLHLLGFGTFIMFFIALWHLVTLQMFRIRKVRLPWEKMTVIPTSDTLAIGGWFDKENGNDFNFEQKPSSEYYAISYDCYSFGIPVAKVSEAVLFFRYNPDSWEVLPNWQDEGTEFGHDTFDFQ